MHLFSSEYLGQLGSFILINLQLDFDPGNDQEEEIILQ